MPAYPIRVSFESHNTATGALITTVLNYEADVLTDPPNYASMASDMLGHFNVPYQNLLSVLDTWDQVVVRAWEVPGQAPGEGSNTVGQVGLRSVTQEDLSPALCAVIHHRTATPKRYARGWTYCPPAYFSGYTQPPATWHNTGAYWTNALAMAAAYHTPFSVSSTGYKPIIFSYTRFKEGKPDYSYDVTGGNVDAKQYFLRRRLTSP